MSNKGETQRKIYGGIFGRIIFILIMLAGIWMIYTGFTSGHENSYHLVVAGAMMFFLALLFLLPKSVPSPWINIVAGCMLTCMGLLHIAVCFMALLGLWLIFYNIFALIGKKNLQNQMDEKTSTFFKKAFQSKLEQAGVLTDEDQNDAMGITDVVDLSEQKDDLQEQEELAFPYQDTAPEYNAPEYNIPEESVPEEPLRPAPTSKFPYFITLFMGIIFSMSGLSHFLMDLRFASFSSTPMNFMNFWFNGIFLTVGLILIIVSIVGFVKNRKSSR